MTGCNSGSGGGNIKSAAAVTKVYGTGQKFIAVAVEYNSDIDTSKLSKTDFRVEGRTVVKVYGNTAADLAEQGRNGKYVIVELSPDDSSALLWGGPSGSLPQQTSSASTTATSATPSGNSGPQAGTTQGPAIIRAAKGIVTQTGAVTTTGGTVYAASSTNVATSTTVNLVVDEFKQFTYKDPKNGQILPYNLYTPANYDKRKSYPLVLFMHDASVVSTTPTATLVQGLGAVCWADAHDQAEREAFVLAPQYPSIVIGDDYKPTGLFDTTAHLVEDLSKQYNIDTGRRYATGQSMGAMMTLGLNIKYPDLFAASWVVAGQWPADQCAPLATKKLWVTVSQGDTKAYPGENEIMDIIEQTGTRVSRAVWNGQSTTAEFAADATALAAQGAPINYSAFLKGTTLSPGETAPGGVEHTTTWPIAYTIEGIRAWIFQQHK
ncbi:alpha/beta hydrolase-fold protein [Nocardia alni]|uniref:alpha/beta hydrolase-fold protein n=1 Tax=Nocardia alni TaxID=2815723 RepID=UPI001C242120|nr:alpha/beta hydrolase-fold protein [Nocardia alni]